MGVPNVNLYDMLDQYLQSYNVSSRVSICRNFNELTVVDKYSSDESCLLCFLLITLYYPVWQVGKIDKKFSAHVWFWRGLPIVLWQFAQYPNRMGVWFDWHWSSGYTVLSARWVVHRNYGRGISGSNLLMIRLKHTGGLQGSFQVSDVLDPIHLFQSECGRFGKHCYVFFKFNGRLLDVKEIMICQSNHMVLEAPEKQLHVG